MDYQMLVLDIDGTLTTSKKEISPATLEALLTIQEEGYYVVLASGRPTGGMMRYANELQLKKYGNYLLSYNGARIMNCKTGEIIYQKTLPQNVIPELYQEALRWEVGIMAYEENCIIAGTPIDRYMAMESRLCTLPIKEVERFDEYVTFPSNKCLMTGEPERLVQVEAALKGRYHSYLSIYRSEPFYLEIMPQQIDKARSLQRLVTSLGLTMDQMICCGDGFNDVAMIEAAGLGVAMSNAQDVVKNVADYITDSNDNEGIVQVIQRFLKKENTH